MKHTITKLVRRLTSWAWQTEIGICEGIAELKALSMEPGSMELKIETSPGIAEHVATCFASIAYKSENYTEMTFECGAKFREKYDYLIVTVQKARGKTPHQLKLEAWAERDKFKAICESLVASDMALGDTVKKTILETAIRQAKEALKS